MKWVKDTTVLIWRITLIWQAIVQNNILQLQRDARFHRVPGIEVVHLVPEAVVRFACEWDIGHLWEASYQNFGFTWYLLGGHWVSTRSQVRIHVAHCEEGFSQNGFDLTDVCGLVEPLVTGVGVDLGLVEENVQLGQEDVVVDEDFCHLRREKCRTVR